MVFVVGGERQERFCGVVGVGQQVGCGRTAGNDDQDIAGVRDEIARVAFNLSRKGDVLELVTRIGIATDYPVFRAKGWHGPGTLGPFGAAAAVGRLRALDSETMAKAFGLAGSQAAAIVTTVPVT